VNPFGCDIGFKPEEGMNGLSLNIDRRDPCWSQNRDILGCMVAEILQQGRLARTGFACDKDIPAAVLEQIKGLGESFVEFNIFLKSRLHVPYSSRL